MTTPEFDYEYDAADFPDKPITDDWQPVEVDLDPVTDDD